MDCFQDIIIEAMFKGRDVYLDVFEVCLFAVRDHAVWWFLKNPALRFYK